MLGDVEAEETCNPEDGVYEGWGEEELGVVQERECCETC